ncbi:hypothetical protein FHETE_6373 [Fusarium heterosporum]|uniref:Uncharacterized protein n=1 Tax=Fusarium heterosporum TaxID=42747 RepID=A0A8H5TAJ1_FUSHE|nr:hypothetical protein FHETE_6373 [Fusarium heterosporum]
MFWRIDIWSASSALEANGSPVDEAIVSWARRGDMADVNVHNTTPAVIGWQWNDATCSLSEPDPKFSDITLTTRFDTTCSLFELSIPIKIKDIRLKDDKAGDNGISTLLLRICPSTIDTFSFASAATAPESTRPKFSSSVTRLDFKLNQTLDILVPTNAQDPIIPGRAHSGVVLDAIRQISNSTSLSIYIQDAVLSKTDLQSLSDAFDQGIYKSTRSSRHAIASLYGGNGAKIIRLAAQTGQNPPPYHETTPPPPSAPLYSKKRPRQDSHDERDNDITRIWAVLANMKERDARTEALEVENRRLRKDVEELRERVALLEKQKEDYERVEAQTSDNTAELVNVDIELADMREDICELKVKADSLERGELADNVKHDVLEFMRPEHYAASLVLGVKALE